MSPAPMDEPLARAFNRAIIEHFCGAGSADAEAVMIAGCTVVGSYIAGVRDSVTRGVLLAQAQLSLGRMVAEVAKADAMKGRDRRGT